MSSAPVTMPGEMVPLADMWYSGKLLQSGGTLKEAQAQMHQSQKGYDKKLDFKREP